MRKLVRLGLPLVVVALVAVQFVQPERTNPREDAAGTFEAVAQPPQELANIVNRSCRDCHTNRTVWPWYSRVAPMSWLVASDVKDGRSHVNFSEWRGVSPEMTGRRMTEVCDDVTKGEMPPWYYLPMHPETKLAPQDVRVLCSWPERQN